MIELKNTLKNIAFFALATLTLTANADLIKAASSVDATVYYDSKTLKKLGNKSNVWVLTNFKEPVEVEGKLHKSSRARFTFDCKNESFLIDGAYFYYESYGKGTVSGSGGKTYEWQPVSPSSIAWPVFQYACK